MMLRGVCPYQWHQMHRGQFYFRKDFIKGLKLSFNVYKIVSFVMDVNVEFSMPAAASPQTYGE